MKIKAYELKDFVDKKKCAGYLIYGQNKGLVREKSQIIINTYKDVNKSKRGNILQEKSDFKEILLPILRNNDYLMIKGSNATGLKKISENLTKGRINAI